MKRVSLSIIIMIILFAVTSCSSRRVEVTPDSIELTDSDKNYIDVVYENKPDWDLSETDSGKKIPINKIGFYRTSDDTLLFVISYPIGAYRLYGYEVTETELLKYNGKLSKAESNAIGISIGVAGINWDTNKGEETLKNTIEAAYRKYKSNEYNSKQ